MDKRSLNVKPDLAITFLKFETPNLGKMKLLILLLIGYLAFRTFKSWLLSGSQQDTVQGKTAAEIDDDMVQDPFCGVYFAKRDGVLLRHQGEDIYFCSAECRDKFLSSSG